MIDRSVRLYLRWGGIILISPWLGLKIIAQEERKVEMEDR